MRLSKPSGSINGTLNKSKGKVYPLVDGRSLAATDRDPNNLDHWNWLYTFPDPIKKRPRCISVPRIRVRRVQDMVSKGRPIVEILEYVQKPIPTETYRVKSKATCKQNFNETQGEEKMITVLLHDQSQISEIFHSQESSMFGLSGVVDRETGEFIVIAEGTELQYPDEEDEEAFNAFERQYIDVPHMGSSDSYEDMKSFIETVEDESLRELLHVAIKGRGAFGRFKDVIRRDEAERQRWFSFTEKRELARVAEWLESKGLYPEREMAGE
jgi:Uncharacterised protein family (UPF0158)